MIVDWKEPEPPSKKKSQKSMIVDWKETNAPIKRGKR